MLQKNELGQIMRFIATRWANESKDPTSQTMAGLPNDFWMNSVGGKTANGGFWVTTLMYTENEMDAAAFKEVLLRWQSRGNSKNGDMRGHGGGSGSSGGSGGSGSSGGPNLIQISKMRSTSSPTDVKNE